MIENRDRAPAGVMSHFEAPDSSDPFVVAHILNRGLVTAEVQRNRLIGGR